ncbi:glycoprotein-N-acetylgalactosamine 3-beta-galactosyltransferase 1-like [Portunus trituberculatus]|uniref:glycoprotein-N-acetylgalactosamine 3-beta-galactosyltransferase 1-like n=1 Tax=Portunus trituberculatus TaxID=210409 RepID=UPI001E1D1230|nr:glycoprotein-N-acetylgalactosamine 3-beta-galactosyltransferase 1-like [Portunus trituberculatus]
MVPQIPLSRRWWLVACVCLAALLFCVLLWPGKLYSKSRPAVLPRGRLLRSSDGGLQRRPRLRPGTQEPRVICMVVTTPQHHRGRSRHLKATWGHWGNGAYPKTVFLSSIPDDVLQNVISHIFQGILNDLSHMPSSVFILYEDLWGKVVDGFLQLNASAADWFLKADDDTFLIYPNLLNLLEHLDPSEALYLGLPLIYRPEEGEEITYMSGGAGYVLSRAALTRLQAARDLAYCRYPGHTRYEDVNMGYCMASLGVRAADTRDGLGRPRFLPYPPWRLLQPEPHPDFAWLVNFSKYKFRFGPESLSDLVITFHEIRDPVDFYLIQYLVNDLRLLPPSASRPFTLSQTPSP